MVGVGQHHHPDGPYQGPLSRCDFNSLAQRCFLANVKALRDDAAIRGCVHSMRTIALARPSPP
jgi:hypothetical protein